MSSYPCLKCSGLVDINEYVDDGQFYSEEQFRCKECGTYLAKEQISTEDMEKVHWASRNHESLKTLSWELVFIILIVILSGIFLFLWF